VRFQKFPAENFAPAFQRKINVFIMEEMIIGNQNKA